MLRRLFVIAFAVAQLSAVTASAIDQQTINDRIKQLQGMSKVERERLDRNIQEFQSLNDQQKQHYRQMHNELAQDRAQTGGLSAVMQTYTLWVQTLSPTQREELQRETDPSRKMALVRRLKEEQEHPKGTPDAQHEETITPPGFKVNPKQGFDSKDLSAVMKVLVDGLPASRMRPEFEQAPLPVNMYLPLIDASAFAGSNAREWPDDAILAKIAAVVKNKDSLPALTKTNQKREAVVRMTLLGIWRLVMESVRFPTDEDRRQTFDMLDPVERERIISLAPEEMTRLLTRKYFEIKGDDSYLRVPEYRRRIIETFERLDVPLPPRFARPKPARDKLMHGKG